MLQLIETNNESQLHKVKQFGIIKVAITVMCMHKLASETHL